MRALEPWHIIILVLVIVILFGWKKLPDAARSLGRSARILKSEMGEMKKDAAGETVPGEKVDPRTQQAPPASAQANAQAGHPQGFPQQPGQHGDTPQYPGSTGSSS
ncbi:Sec-independent protein translocase subunit TatA [Calidifontibacter sp. DB0510]|uniref:Sec-independent protein translocase protein TatA n=1 Tax=Metallococcus carri TaxID=1656884 RepID=A0A967AZQ9_9MICO|nr:Sec-independent protein translocase subunit TatA [Metallococcus carri]NHN54800.1 Sec-independent protein translocase subunit TatA [Metallococcus carri]NOP37145.1 Sec-independent protein translocase subunit TatA [Calidifontibacter sp. DB2511S]